MLLYYIAMEDNEYMTLDILTPKQRYYFKNKEKIIEYVADYQKNHQEQRKKSNISYYQKNCEILKAKRREKYAREKEAKCNLQ